jgi:predicted nuclease of restriction endonuclease-like (RecB) superfamily
MNNKPSPLATHILTTAVATAVSDAAFSDVLHQIQRTRHAVFAHANTALIDLYWHIGQTISNKVHSQAWGKGVVSELAQFIARSDPSVKGFSDKNLWRMKQFYETYCTDEKLATLWRVLSWSHNRLIMTLKSSEERAFYLRLSTQEKLSVRELERQIDSAQFERTVLSPPKLSVALRELHPSISQAFKDSYVLEFLGLPDPHSERDLQQSLVARMKTFILELGKDFIFMGQAYRLQVGNQDFYIDLLFYHRGLSALVAFELKIGKFMPEHLGQLNFYLEALDRDVKKPQENPSIGVLLCRDKDDEVVEYALSRNLSPALIAQYQLQLPDKQLLQAKIHELFANLPDLDSPEAPRGAP